MYSIAHSTGKLVEICIWSPVSVEEATRWAREHDQVLQEIKGPYVCIVDVVEAAVFPQAVVDAYVATMRREPRLLRTGVLLNQSPTLRMQVQRMLREANSSARKMFDDTEGVAHWLDDVLDARERKRLREVLARREKAPSSRRWQTHVA
ncbi:hypothetical protein [Chondromyces apiculatus]|uniref:STAS/SEC14 domain-containing protein n=1 Tax=Chondromyces apiculatus DSM 436 TaxID=1192034 RepID=A0A017TI34_9BACT|nr:hypothetical protein [Chondromyces apiculatus]EYF08914.1 Hypothetical protein CAP_2775 [Chondromyces apiculatus DSM 436]